LWHFVIYGNETCRNAGHNKHENQPKRNVMKHLLLSVIALGVLAACVPEEEPAPQQPDEIALADIEAGRAIATAECAACHGMDGRGMAPGIPHLAAQNEEYMVESLHDYEQGRRTHAALRDLSSLMNDNGKRNVAAYYASLPPLESSPGGSESPVPTPYEEGKSLALSCVECHGENGVSTTPGIPSLAGQQPLYFIASTQAYLHGVRNIETMEASLRGMSQRDIEKMALYFASQKPSARQAPPVGDPAAGEPLSAGCGGCHGANGVSRDAATPSLAGQDAIYLANAAKAYRGHVRDHNVMFASSSDKEIEDIAAFYSVQMPQAAEIEPATAQKLVESCDRCHGPGVENPALVVPNLAGQDEAYLIMAMRAYRDDRRKSSMMHKMSLPYSDTMIEEVAAEYAGRSSR
jgi:cytochrome c553